MARKKKAAAGGHGNAERWLLTYADMITLLMAFFIMMYSMSIMNMAKFQQLALSVREGFGGVIKDTKSGQNSGRNLMQTANGRRTINWDQGLADNASMMQALDALENFAKIEHLRGKVDVHEEERGLVMTLAAEGLLFQRGSAEISGPYAYDVLGKVADVLKQIPDHNILVEGHTCNLPISTEMFPSNWELSAARASRVVRVFESRQIAAKLLSAVGYGSSHPLVANDTEAHRMLNRRVDIVILRGALHDISRADQPGALQIAPNLSPELQKVIKMDQSRGGAQ